MRRIRKEERLEERKENVKIAIKREKRRMISNKKGKGMKG